jgi:DNA-binding GntR family transcriptional regulator
MCNLMELSCRRPEISSDSTHSSPRQLVRERVFQAVRSAIVEGRIAPGTRLTERELCESYGISRTVVREVIRMLAAEKLAEVTAHKGLRVAALTRKRANEICELRIELEAMVIRGFLAAATDDHILMVQNYWKEWRKSRQRLDKVDMAEKMANLLSFMSEIADNQVAAEILGQLRARINMLRVLAMNEPGQVESSMDGLDQTILAITARDADAAERAVRAFVRRSGEAVLRQMDRQNQADSLAR